jgi:hypothetical protein
MVSGRNDPIPHDDRVGQLSARISYRTLEGWNVITRNDNEVVAVLSLPEKRVNHVLHFIITILTCLVWGIVWAIIAGTHRQEQRLRVSVDARGNLTEEVIVVR